MFTQYDWWSLPLPPTSDRRCLDRRGGEEVRLRPTFLLAASSDVVDDDMSRFSRPSLALLGLHSIRRRLSLAFDGRRPPT